jgi:hypothetical protein
MTTPNQRISRLINEEARFVAYLPGNIIIDVTPDIMAAMAEVSSKCKVLANRRNLLIANDLRRDVPTGVQFP